MNQQRSVGKTIGPKLSKKTSEYRELSQESWSSEKDTSEETSRKLVHRTLSKGMYLEHSESQEHSQNSQKKQAGADMGNVEVTVGAKDNKCPAAGSDFLEHSQNSLSSGEPELDKGEANMSSSDPDSQCLAMISEFQELSSNSRVETECSEGTQDTQHAHKVCVR